MDAEKRVHNRWRGGHRERVNGLAKCVINLADINEALVMLKNTVQIL